MIGLVFTLKNAQLAEGLLEQRRQALARVWDDHAVLPEYRPEEYGPPLDPRGYCNKRGPHAPSL